MFQIIIRYDKWRTDENLFGFISQLRINYPVRIHHCNLCRCHRIKTRTQSLPLMPDEKVLFVLEKIWDDGAYKNFPSFIHITEKRSAGDMVPELSIRSIDTDKILISLFGNMIGARKKIVQYFRDYELSYPIITEIRKMIKQMKPICFCRDIIFSRETTCNSGFIILGRRWQMELVSHLFNKYITPGEYSRLYFVKLSNLPLLNKEIMGYNLRIFLESYEFLELRNGCYTVVGLEAGIKPVYSFVFGKREWCAGRSETPFECAKRELYEEFNIQFTKKLYGHSALGNKIQKIHRPGALMFLLYLDERTMIGYHGTSETIILDMQ